MNLFPGIIHSFGIPRHILSQGPDARYRIARDLHSLAPDKSIHLLGTHTDFPYELYYYAEEYNALGVRGVDTSMAWNATREGINLGDQLISRTSRASILDFMNATLWDDERMDLLVANMDAIASWIK
jgi:hypothetical protein